MKMEIIDVTILNVVCILMPLTIYLLYTAYEKTFNKKENDLLILITMFTMIYMSLKYDTSLVPGLPLLWINIPLIIAYYKKSSISILITSVLIISYYYIFYSNYLVLIIAEYILYYLLFSKAEKHIKFNISILLFCTLKLIFILFMMSYIYQGTNIINYFIGILFEVIFLYIAMSLTIIILEKTEDMLKLHMNLKEIERDKQIKTSLFQITHEIKNPIAVCKGYLDMFDVNNPKHAKKYIPILKEEINRTLILLEDFLSMNKVKVNKEPLDINLLLDEVIKNMKMMCHQNNIEIQTDILDDEIYISGDYNRLTQVFVNIIKNSIEACNKKNSKIKIWTEIIDNKIKINIKDNGKGMSKEVLEKIKEPFYTTKKKGTGLGVSLSNEIILAHNGTLEYASKEYKYTLVTATLPIQKLY